MIVLKPVASKKDWDQFIGFAWEIYAGDSYWVPPLRIAVRDLLDVAKNPFFRHAIMHPVLAIDDTTGRCVGRIVGVVDDNHNKYHSEKTGFFGFFECVNDQKVANLLLDEAARWVKAQGMNLMRGPMNPSTNHECGLLVEGFDDPPAVMMTYNPRYYLSLLENWGLTKSKDLFAYNLTSGKAPYLEKLWAQAERLKSRATVTFRTVNMSKFKEELGIILDIYNDAWEKNWGFVPMEPLEFEHMAKDMKAIIDPELVLIAEVRGKPAGFALALPDVNQVFKKVSDGKLLPFGIFKLLWNLKGPGKRKTMNRARILTLGIKRAYVENGIGPLLYTEYFKRGPKAGYDIGEASWILEDNGPMNKALSRMFGERYKVYRLYDKAI